MREQLHSVNGAVSVNLIHNWKKAILYTSSMLRWQPWKYFCSMLDCDSSQVLKDNWYVNDSTAYQLIQHPSRQTSINYHWVRTLCYSLLYIGGIPKCWNITAFHMLMNCCVPQPTHTVLNYCYEYESSAYFKIHRLHIFPKCNWQMCVSQCCLP